MAICSVEEAVEDIRQGRMIILVDDEDRENEGDITIAGRACDARGHQFMAKYAAASSAFRSAPASWTSWISRS